MARYYTVIRCSARSFALEKMVVVWLGEFFFFSVYDYVMHVEFALKNSEFEIFFSVLGGLSV